MAAAAVLLLLMSVVAIYTNPAKQIVRNTAAEKVESHQTPGAKKQQILPSQAQPETPVVLGETRAISTHPKPNASVHFEKEMQPTMAGNQIKENTLTETATQPAPVNILPKSMPVVYIGEAESNAAQQKSISVAAAAAPDVDFNKMRVVHINDVEKEEKEVKQIRRENRMSLGHYPFFRSESDYYESETPHESVEYREARKPFKNIFNPQN